MREHHRKLRREERVKSHKKKEQIHVPNKCPFKEEVLKEMQEKRSAQEELKAARKEAVKKVKQV